MWTHLSRYKGGGIGLRGPGETQLEEDRRLVGQRIRDLKDRLAEVQARKEREVKSRPRGAHRLAGRLHQRRQEHADERPDRGRRLRRGQALLDARHPDPAVARSRTGAGCCSRDTVGFIRDLPHHLVASFKATLEEARQARLLLHVVDASNPHAEEQIKAVNEVLKELGCDDEADAAGAEQGRPGDGPVAPGRAAGAPPAGGGGQRGDRRGAGRRCATR